MLAVIFDMDGVIFDTEAICLRAWRACAEKYNIKDMDAQRFYRLDEGILSH